MKQAFILLTALVVFNRVCGQTIFFKSNNGSQKDNSGFYSSLRIQDSLLLFNADDYKLYVYNKNTMQLKWSYALGWKSAMAPFVINDQVWCQTNENEMIRLDILSGKLLSPLNMGSVKTEPIIKNNIVYFTGIYDLGRIFAYDLAGDSVLWSKFIAHGCSVRPFYLDDKMIVNAEGDNWIELRYDGKFVNKECENEEYHFPSELSCAKEFKMLTHDNKEIKGSLADQLFENQYSYDILKSTNNTCILSNETMVVIGNRLKLKMKISIQSLNDTIELDEYNYMKILSVTDGFVCFIHSGHFIRYDLLKKMSVRDIDLSGYEIAQAVLEGNKLWLISKKDKLLYGITIR